MKKKIALLLACVMAFGIAVGGTLAWLTDATTPVVNTFTDSDINITLTESENLNLQMIPGHTITKDPKVTVDKDSEECYVFVKVVENNNTIDGLDAVEGVENSATKVLLYSVDSAWTKLEDADNVYYQTVTGLTTDWSDNVLTGDQVVVNQNVTKAMMNDTLTSAQPTLTFTAYASQYYKSAGVPFTAAEAWANVNPTT